MTNPWSWGTGEKGEASLIQSQGQGLSNSKIEMLLPEKKNGTQGRGEDR
jgi:hypothetical protein